MHVTDWVLVQISLILATDVATGVGTRIALDPSWAGVAPLVAWRAPVPAKRRERAVTVTPTFQIPAAGSSISVANQSGQGVRGDRSCVFS